MYPAHWAAVKPDAPAVIVADRDETLSYAELDDRSRRLVALLRNLGVNAGGHIAVMLPNTAHYFEIVWAALLSGLRVTPLSSHSTPDDAAYILGDAGCDLFITTAEFTDRVSELPALVPSCRNWLWMGQDSDYYLDYHRAVTQTEPAVVDPNAQMGDFMLYSSGTTGRPKGVKRAPAQRTVSQGSIANRFLSKVFSADENTVFLSPAPLYHGAPLGFSTGVISLGGTVVVMTKFDAERALEAIARHHVTHSQWVPTMFIRMLALPEQERLSLDLSSHQVAIHSAAPCPRHVKEQMMDWWGPILHEYYSGTEDIGVTYASPEQWLAHPGTVGKPLGFTIHICDEDGNELPPTSTGIVYFETRSAGFQYHGDSEKTRKSRHPRHPNWVTLDDIGHLDEDGFLYLTDRASFMIISGGVNIYPREVEDVLLRHPAVADCGVIGVPDPEFGEQVLAVIEPVAGTDTGPALIEDLKKFARENLAGPKRPRSYEFIDRLPRMETGKLSKHALRRLFAAPTT